MSAHSITHADKAEKTFQDLFCAMKKCQPDSFLEQCYRTGIPLGRRWLAHAGSLLDQEAFSDDLELIESLGGTSSIQEFKEVYKSHHYRNPPQGILRGVLKARLSGKKLSRVAAQAFHHTGPNQ
jgi:hypothetical protein